MASACSNPLPDPESVDAQVYVRECGMCHPPIGPGLMTAAMWRMQVARMDRIRRERGLPPIGHADREVVLRYLEQHAG